MPFLVPGKRYFVFFGWLGFEFWVLICYVRVAIISPEAVLLESELILLLEPPAAVLEVH